MRYNYLSSSNKWSVRKGDSNFGGYVEFEYNNSYQASIGMTSYEDLYGRRCRSSICWDEISKRKLLDPKLVLVIIEKVALIGERLKTT